MKSIVRPLLAVCFAAATLSAAAETIRFRGGEVLAAELTTKAPNIANADELPNDTAAARGYVLITVRPLPGLTLGTPDYSVSILGKAHPCIAIRTENGPFDAKNREINDTRPAAKYGMLFLVDASVIRSGEAVSVDLVCNAPGKYKSVELPLTNLRDKELTAAGRIPAAGSFKKAE